MKAGKETLCTSRRIGGVTERADVWHRATNAEIDTSQVGFFNCKQTTGPVVQLAHTPLLQAFMQLVLNATTRPTMVSNCIHKTKNKSTQLTQLLLIRRNRPTLNTKHAQIGFFRRRTLLDNDSFDKLKEPLGILIRSDGRDLSASAVFDGFSSLRRAFLHAVVR